MAANDVIKTSLERNWGMVDRALDGLDDTILAQQISGETNSIAWLLFHMTRVVDTFINTRLQDKPQLWVQDGWCEKCGLSDDPETTGQGWSSEKVAAWAVPTRVVLLGYFEATKAAAREYLDGLPRAAVSKTAMFFVADHISDGARPIASAKPSGTSRGLGGRAGKSINRSSPSRDTSNGPLAV